MWSFFLCQLPTSENRLTFELTDCRLVHVLYPSLALLTSVNRRPTTLANTSTQNSKIYCRFSLFYDLSTKRLWKSNLRAKTTYHHSKILLILWHAKLLRSERSAGSEMASGDVVQLSTGFEKETSNSSPCCETAAPRPSAPKCQDCDRIFKPCVQTDKSTHSHGRCFSLRLRRPNFERSWMKLKCTMSEGSLCLFGNRRPWQDTFTFTKLQVGKHTPKQRETWRSSVCCLLQLTNNDVEFLARQLRTKSSVVVFHGLIEAYPVA